MKSKHQHQHHHHHHQEQEQQEQQQQQQHDENDKNDEDDNYHHFDEEIGLIRHIGTITHLVLDLLHRLELFYGKQQTSKRNEMRGMD
jgi:hypothetical protein